MDQCIKHRRINAACQRPPNPLIAPTDRCRIHSPSRSSVCTDGSVHIAPMDRCCVPCHSKYLFAPMDQCCLLKTFKVSGCTERSVHIAPTDRCQPKLHRWIGDTPTDGSVQLSKHPELSLHAPMDRWSIASSKFSACTERSVALSLEC